MKDEKKHAAEFVKASFMLRAGSWTRSLPELQYKYMIAAALNEVIYDTGPIYKRFLVNGYLVFGRRIYIACKVRAISIDTILELFYEKVRMALVHEAKKRMEKERYNGIKQDEIAIPATGLFEIFPFDNEWLKQLITGNTVQLRYYDPRLARLKDIIHQEQFCSLADYAGEEGPVVVSKENNKEAQENSRDHRIRSAKRRKQ